MIALTLDLHSFTTVDMLREILYLGAVDKDTLPWKIANAVFIPFFSWHYSAIENEDKHQFLFLFL